MAFSWTCPFCSQPVTITDDHFIVNTDYFHLYNKYGRQYVSTQAISCPNPDCREYTLSVSIYDAVKDRNGNTCKKSEPKKTWSLIPSAEIKVFPDYIPNPIISDYQEACSIRDLSPKASATLSRRCLQGMIRDFWGIKKDTLHKEITELKDKIDSVTWAAIVSVRKIGNIGAHMEKDINLIVDVEPNEAKLLLGLIEILIKEWYITKHDREQRMASVIALAEEKDNQKKENKDS